MQNFNHLDWDFKSIKSNNIHRYPATFLPDLAEQILECYLPDNDKPFTVLDPFVGSGTTLLACQRYSFKHKHKMTLYGSDLNPLALLVSKVKTTFISEDIIDKAWDIIQKESQLIQTIYSSDGFWMHELTYMAIKRIYESIKNIQNESLRNFFVIALSDCIWGLSYCHNSGFKLHRNQDKIGKSYDINDVLGKMQTVVNRNKLIVSTIRNDYINGLFISKHDATMPLTRLNNRVDMILTSPPYGDSRTTVAYGQSVTLSCEILELDTNIRQLDKKLMGGLIHNTLNLGESETLALFMQKLDLSNKKNQQRWREVLAFYYDLWLVMHNCSNVLKQGGKLVMVVANRTVMGYKIQTDHILIELAIGSGLVPIDSQSRLISKKRTPTKVSASNKKGETVSTMDTETILIFEKV